MFALKASSDVRRRAGQERTKGCHVPTTQSDAKDAKPVMSLPRGFARRCALEFAPVDGFAPLASSAL